MKNFRRRKRFEGTKRVFFPPHAFKPDARSEVVLSYGYAWISWREVSKLTSTAELKQTVQRRLDIDTYTLKLTYSYCSVYSRWYETTARETNITDVSG
jgi:hypothetical protein